MSDVDLLSEAEFTAGLRQWASGSHQTEAATGLLLAHRDWLRRDDFRRRTLWVDVEDDAPRDRPRLVGIDWEAAAELLDAADASGSERRILAIAVALVSGREHPVDLGDVLTCLDASNSVLVVRAVAHATGLQERHASMVVADAVDV